ncbi:MAG: leucine--tRNA ligase [Bifidobacteriaceae bacterium]|jgi:leucyl-tRNA synthetase|nr:leucine--tRNA ligase [Bifidobacteriaceae bacterium]
MTDNNPENPQFRYTAEMANDIELKWQKIWDENKTFAAPNTSDKPPYYVLDMFPYPSGAGLHVGHPLGYIATDVMGRFKRMTGFNVLHPFGFDAFGLPAEQYAVQTGQHPKKTTLENIDNMKRQLGRMGLAHDKDRTFATIDDDYVKWTQWIFTKIYNSYFDEELNKAQPIQKLIEKFESSNELNWNNLNLKERTDILNEYRLVYISNSPVNWCPGLGTVLANEEVTAEGKSERGNFPVFQKELKQWSMRITSYSQRLIDDLEFLDWPEKVKSMQENWIGKSSGAYIDFDLVTKTDESVTYINDDESTNELRVFTTRPDTLRGATFMVVAPEHPLVQSAIDQISADSKNAETVALIKDYVKIASGKTAVERQQDAGKKTGQFLGIYGTNPVNGSKLPVFVADYVLMGYGTGAIMAVPADDKRDEEFAETLGVEIIRDYEKFDSIQAAIDEFEAAGYAKAVTNYRLRDWLFSRQRYWGEPFPVIYDEDEIPYILEKKDLPLTLPDVPDYSPKTFAPDDASSRPEAPLSRNADWINIELDLGDGLGKRKFHRDENTMPNWAGSCWYYLRYLDPHNADELVSKDIEKYWMGDTNQGGVGLYVGGVEHAVLHLLYARFWHKILFDLDVVSTPEPFHKLFNQGYIQAYAYTDSRGAYKEAANVEPDKADPKKFVYTDAASGNTETVYQEYGKMGKSLKNVVTPDEMYQAYGADTFRIYEMSMGPLDLSRPWDTRSVVGSSRFLQRLMRNIVDEISGDLVVLFETPDDETLKLMHTTICEVQTEYENMRPNTVIARLISLNNHIVKTDKPYAEVIINLLLMLSPLAPHFSEEMISLIYEKSADQVKKFAPKYNGTITYCDFPTYDEKYLVKETITAVAQVNGKLKAKFDVPADISKDDLEKIANEQTPIISAIEEGTLVKTIVIPPKLVNFVVR